jgi:hypothetical protein
MTVDLVSSKVGSPRAVLPAGMRAQLVAISTPAVGLDSASPGRAMPTVAELERAGRDDLVRLISAAGGQSAVADALDLRLVRGRRRAAGAPPDETADAARARVCAELRAHALASGRPGEMPSTDQLAAAGRHDLLWSARVHLGGLRAAAQAAGLSRPPAERRLPAAGARARGYWREFATVQLELGDFNEAHGTVGTMPTQAVLRAHGRFDLSAAISRHHGGVHAVAARLSLALAHGRAAPRAWTSVPRVLAELRAFVEANGTAGQMPTVRALQACGRHDLTHAICSHHGGRMALARLAELDYVGARARRPRGYWHDLPTIHAELRAFVSAHGTAGVMPSTLEFQVAGSHGRRLLRAIEERGGGLRALADAEGLSVPSGRAFGVWVIDATESGGAGGPLGGGASAGRWQRQVATVDSEEVLATRSRRRRVQRKVDESLAQEEAEERRGRE